MNPSILTNNASVFDQSGLKLVEGKSVGQTTRGWWIDGIFFKANEASRKGNKLSILSNGMYLTW
jgi:hypothetical protein